MDQILPQPHLIIGGDERHLPSPTSDIRIEHLDSVEETLRREHPVIWLLTLVGPFLAASAFLVAVWMILGGDYLRRMAVVAAASLWMFGRFVILSGSDPDVATSTGGLSSMELFLMVLFLDVSVALFLTFHLNFLFRIPWVGPKMRLLMFDGRFILDHQPWIRRATFAGLIAFVAFPLAATGSVGGTILGRLLGLRRSMTLFGILLGSLLGNGLMLWASGLVNSHINRNHPIVNYGGLAVIIGLVFFLESRYPSMRNRFVERNESLSCTTAAGSDFPLKPHE